LRKFILQIDGKAEEKIVPYKQLHFGNIIKSMDVNQDTKYWVWSPQLNEYREVKVDEVVTKDNKFYIATTTVTPKNITKTITVPLSNQLLLELNDGFNTKFQKYGNKLFLFILSFQLIYITNTYYNVAQTYGTSDFQKCVSSNTIRNAIERVRNIIYYVKCFFIFFLIFPYVSLFSLIFLIFP